MRNLTRTCYLIRFFFAITSGSVSASWASDCPPQGHNFPAFYNQTETFTEAISAVSGAWGEQPSGITVPHHLLVPTLLADGISRARGYDYDRIVLLFPDHFRMLDTSFGTVTNGFDTVLGPVPTDPKASEIAAFPEFSTTCTLANDHGIRALLPFVAEALPGVPILPVAVSIKTRIADWKRLSNLLEPYVNDRTLVLQSTDFSHYLPHHEARLRDQETLNVLAAGDLGALADLKQPDHMDSAGAMYVQMALQQRHFNAHPVVVANLNSQDYSSVPLSETTSYMVILFSHTSGILPGPIAGERLLIGGDTFFGRSIRRSYRMNWPQGVFQQPSLKSQLACQSCLTWKACCYRICQRACHI